MSVAQKSKFEPWLRFSIRLVCTKKAGETLEKTCHQDLSSGMVVASVTRSFPTGTPYRRSYDTHRIRPRPFKSTCEKIRTSHPKLLRTLPWSLSTQDWFSFNKLDLLGPQKWFKWPFLSNCRKELTFFKRGWGGATLVTKEQTKADSARAKETRISIMSKYTPGQQQGKSSQSEAQWTFLRNFLCEQVNIRTVVQNRKKEI